MELHPGISAEKTIIVESRHIAAHLGSGGVPVYATPSMVLHMEEISRETVDHLLENNQLTVGSYISVKHLAPTPLGMKVRIRSELLEQEGRKLKFKIEAWDEVEKVGEAEHVRTIVDLDRFSHTIERKKMLMRTR